MPNETKLKVIVSHPERQHSFRLATALKKQGLLFKYITTVYKKKNSFFYRILEKVLSTDNQKRAKGRRCDALDDHDVIQFNERLGLLLLLLYRIDREKRWSSKLSSYISNDFQKKVAEYAIEHKVDAVIMYDTNTATCFDVLKKKAPHIKRIMDVSAANGLYLKQVYEEDMIRAKSFASKLYKERAELWDKVKAQEIAKELAVTEYFIGPSNFVKESLLFSDVDSNSIYLCPYGTNKLIAHDAEKKASSALKIVYVGNVTAMKGIYYLLEALKNFDPSKVKLTLVGNYDNSDGVFDEYMEQNQFLGLLTPDKLATIYSNCDVMVFPSLGDSFGQVVLEAMHFGIPVICSTNAGAVDIIKDHYNGFIVPPGDTQAIQEKIQWFLDHKEKMSLMRKNAYHTAEKYSWQEYEKKVVCAMEEILSI